MATREERVILRGEDKASREFKKAETSFSRMSGTIKKLAIAGGIAIGIQQLGRMGKEAVMAAVDAEEAAAAFETTFGGAVAQASAFVEEFANIAGFTRAELQQLMAVNGNVVQGMGATEAQSAALSERMVRLAGDVASFSNAQGGAEAVLLALQSAINGEREALKTYGLAINEAEVQQKALTMTGKAHVSELTRLDKALATVELGFDKAAKAVGDLERTQDSSANTLRRVNALWGEQQIVIGQALLPALEKLLPVIGDLIPVLGDILVPIFMAMGSVLGAIAPLLSVIAEVFSAIPAPVLAAAIAFAIMSTRAGLLSTGVLRLGSGISGLMTGTGALGGRLKSLVGFINPVTVAVGAAIAAFTIWKGEQKKNEEAAESFAETLDEETSAITANTVAWVRQQLIERDNLELLNDLGISVEDFVELLSDESEGRAELIERLEEQAGAIIDLEGVTEEEAQAAADLIRTIKFLTRARQDGTKAAREERRSILLATQAEREQKGEVTRLTGAYARFRPEITHATTELWDLSEAERLTTTRGLELMAAGRLASEAMHEESAAAAADRAELDRLAEMHKTLAGEMALATEEQRTLTSALKEAASPVFAAVASYGRYQDALARAEELQKSGKATAEELALAQIEIAETAIEAQIGLDALDPTSLNKALDSIAIALGSDREAVRAFLTELGILQGTKTTTVIEFQTQVTGPGAAAFAGMSASQLHAKGLIQHAGGLVPEGPGGSDVFTRLQPGEFVLRKNPLDSLAGMRSFGPLLKLASLLMPRPSPGRQTAVAPHSSGTINLTVVLDRRVLTRAILPNVPGEIKVRAGSHR